MSLLQSFRYYVTTHTPDWDLAQARMGLTKEEILDMINDDSLRVLDLERLFVALDITWEMVQKNAVQMEQELVSALKAVDELMTGYQEEELSASEQEATVQLSEGAQTIQIRIEHPIESLYEALNESDRTVIQQIMEALNDMGEVVRTRKKSIYYN